MALVSTVSTAFAHAYLKAGKSKLAVQAWVRLTELTAALPLAWWVGFPPPELVAWLIAAATVHAFYQLALIWSYSVSDFSIAFPLARGATPLFTTAMGVTLLGDALGPLMLIGVGIVSAGTILLALRGTVTRTGLIAAGTTAMLTTCYTVIDARGVRLASNPLVFVAWFFVADGIAMPLVLVARERGQAIVALASDRRTGLTAGFLALCSFAPALFAFDLAPVGAVSALRECSVLIGIALGGTMLKERLDRHRVLGAVLIVLGGFAIIAQSL